MDIALCFEIVLPSRGGSATYICSLARRLATDGHTVHLYARRWDAEALPSSIRIHPIRLPPAPRFLRQWLFGAACERALAAGRHDLTIGFDKTWGQDILYPQGGLHAACVFHNRLKHRSPFVRAGATLLKWLDPAVWSYRLLERKQYFWRKPPQVIAISHKVQADFHRFYGAAPASVRVVHAGIDPSRVAADDREARRRDERRRLGIAPDEPVGLFVAVNFRLKGLEPLIRSLPHVGSDRPYRIVVAGHADHRRYARLAERLGVADRLRFVGFRRDIKDLYFASDFLVHPTFYDPCSLVVLEALACGLPVITTAFNGAVELLTSPKCGLIIDDPHDAPTLAGAIGRMLDPAFRAESSKAALDASTCWSFDHHFAALLRVFAEVHKAKGSKAPARQAAPAPVPLPGAAMGCELPDKRPGGAQAV